MKRKWSTGRNTLWFVFGENGAIWLGSASFTKRGAIRHWQEQQPDDSHPWTYWYRHGFRCRKAHIKYSIST